jgi:hypothetical protein
MTQSLGSTFFHPDYTVGSGVTPDPARAYLEKRSPRPTLLVGFTTGGELRFKFPFERSPRPEGPTYLVLK